MPRRPYLPISEVHRRASEHVADPTGAMLDALASDDLTSVFFCYRDVRSFTLTAADWRDLWWEHHAGAHRPEPRYLIAGPDEDTAILIERDEDDEGHIYIDHRPGTLMAPTESAERFLGGLAPREGDVTDAEAQGIMAAHIASTPHRRPTRADLEAELRRHGITVKRREPGHRLLPQKAFERARQAVATPTMKRGGAPKT